MFHRLYITIKLRNVIKYCIKSFNTLFDFTNIFKKLIYEIKR